jgi:hypothetical protein
MGPLVTTLATVVVGAALAIAAAFGIVGSMSGKPDPVDKPLVQYGSR